MKKLCILFTLAGIISLASCDTKSCRCYEYVGNQWTGPHTYTAEAGTRCSALNNNTTYCNEMDDPIIDPSDIANGKK